MEELLFDRIRMKISDAQFRVSTDSMVLADFCRIRPGSRVLDLGCGCGTLGLLLLGADETLRVCGIEIQEAAARQARENAEENGVSDRFCVVCGDLRQTHAQIAPGSFDYVLSNPPYYPPKSGHLHAQDSLSAARSEICCPFDALCAAAARALRCGADVFSGSQAGAAGRSHDRAARGAAGAEAHPLCPAQGRKQRKSRFDRSPPRRRAWAAI